MASSTMLATGENFFNAFAVFLNATVAQMGWLTAIPQLFGAIFQLLSVWLGNYVPRRPLVVVAAMAQGVAIGGMGLLAVWFVSNPDSSSTAVITLIVLAVLYFSLLNLIQPQWRAWMGSIVPRRRRGTFFASRTRLSQMISLLVYLGGGALLSVSQHINYTWLGFAILFLFAAGGRGVSSWLLWKMHDPDPHHFQEHHRGLQQSLKQVMLSLQDRNFRNYTFLVAGMQGMVAISAPFFSVYMLRDLHFTYWQYVLNSMASVVVQFGMLHFWGRFSDNYGNRIIMLICSFGIPVVPLLWLFSANHWYLILIQMLAGVFWSGFTLSTSNYLYDIRPHKTDFATYAAMQSGLSAVAVFCGAVFGGWLATISPDLLLLMPEEWRFSNALFIVFLATTILRLAVAVWFAPRCVEPRQRRPQLLQVIYRVSRFSTISGIALDWMSVTKKRVDNTKSTDDGGH